MYACELAQDHRGPGPTRVNMQLYIYMHVVKCVCMGEHMSMYICAYICSCVHACIKYVCVRRKGLILEMWTN